MEQKRNGFGTRIGFELAAAGSAVGLGNLWGFPYKASANGGAAYLFVYLACIFSVCFDGFSLEADITENQFRIRG